MSDEQAPPGREARVVAGKGSVILNIIWLVFAGFWLAVSYVIAGVVQCLFIVTIPFGIQCFKLAGFVLWPFGRAIVKRPDRHRALGMIGNFLWFFLAGFWLAIVHLVTGVLLCATVIGIPLGLGNFELIPFSLLPFGKDIVRRGDVYDGPAVAF